MQVTKMHLLNKIKPKNKHSVPHVRNFAYRHWLELLELLEFLCRHSNIRIFCFVTSRISPPSLNIHVLGHMLVASFNISTKFQWSLENSCLGRTVLVVSFIWLQKYWKRFRQRHRRNMCQHSPETELMCDEEGQRTTAKKLAVLRS